MVNTITVQRANVVLDIDESQKDYYLGQGYSVIDAKTGEIIEDSTVQTVESLNNKLERMKALVEQKDEEIQKLKKQLSKQAKNKE